MMDQVLGRARFGCREVSVVGRKVQGEYEWIGLLYSKRRMVCTRDTWQSGECRLSWDNPILVM